MIDPKAQAFATVEDFHRWADGQLQRYELVDGYTVPLYPSVVGFAGA